MNAEVGCTLLVMTSVDGSIGTTRAEQLRAFLSRYRLHVSSLELIDRALTHSSYAFENQILNDNERLEFLGDAVLSVLVSEFLYSTHPRAREGVLSKHKASMVSRTVLGKRAAAMGVGEILRLGRGEEMGGGRERPVLLGSTLEAVIGALYLEIGLEGIRPFVEREICEPTREMTASDEFGDYKSMLQELVQRFCQGVPEYEVIFETGPDHNKNFEVVVRVNREICGKGEGSRKKLAENLAAMQAYWMLNYLYNRQANTTPDFAVRSSR